MKIKGEVDINTLLTVIAELISVIGVVAATAKSAGATDQQLESLDARLSEAIDRRKAALAGG